ELKRSGNLLLAHRNKRIRPLLDDKIILGWNALMNTACSKAFAATGNEGYRQLAIENMEFLLSAFAESGSEKLYHTWKDDQARYPAFLDDYASLIQALIQLQEITTNTRWLIEAEKLTSFVLDNFSETETAYFYYTPVWQNDVIIRKKEVYDGAVPSGNSVMGYNLWQLSLLLDKEDWQKRAREMVSSLGLAVVRYPTSFGNWGCLLQEIVAGTSEIAIIGGGFLKTMAEVLAEYIPHRVLMASDRVNPDFPLLIGKSANEQTTIYLCRNYTCLNPVFSAKELMLLINKGKNR
ncbi:MAG: thioredoxin domain-containing protein, partial [Chitinophagaceae bacterium]|nr:thioredoxin domain-containing protein [Chitinophagaceae bacterium]